MECGFSFCLNCKEELHSKGKYKSHKFVPHGSVKVKCPCKQHPDQQLHLYCENDKVLVCLICAQYGNHVGHKCVLLHTTLATQIQQTASQLQQIIPQLSSLLSDYHSGKDHLILVHILIMMILCCLFELNLMKMTMTLMKTMCSNRHVKKQQQK